MIDAGDLYLADLGSEVRHRVLVVSKARFHRVSGRALVCPEMTVVPEQRFPWWIDTDAGVFALDRLATLPLDRLLDQVGRTDAGDVARLRAALAAIT